jgi:cell division septation protein DedD
VLRKGESLKPPFIKLDDFEENWRISLQQGLLGAVSFELPGLGMCYRQEGFYEVLPSQKTPQLYPADFGLNALSVKPIDGTKIESPPITQINAGKRWNQSTWWLKIAAVFLALLFINLLTLQLLTKDGKITLNQVAELNPFDSLNDRSPFTFDEEADLDTEMAAIEAKMNQIINPVTPDSVGAMDALVQPKKGANQIEFLDRPADTSNKASTMPVMKKSVDESRMANAQNEKPSSTEVQNLKATNTQTKGQVQIVVGAFADLANAKTLSNKLKAEGWECAISKADGSTLHRVSVLMRAGQDAEEAALQDVKQKINPQAWILASN